MGMFSRMNDIVQSNINVMLDKAEDPQKVMRMIIQEMEETLVELRTISARNIAEKKQFTRKIERLQIDAQHWANKAELAIGHDKTSLARAALVQKQQCIEEIDVLEKQLVIINENLTALETDAQRLHAKLADARSKQKALNTREVSQMNRYFTVSTHVSIHSGKTLNWPPKACHQMRNWPYCNRLQIYCPRV